MDLILHPGNLGLLVSLKINASPGFPPPKSLGLLHNWPKLLAWLKFTSQLQNLQTITICSFVIEMGESDCPGKGRKNVGNGRNSPDHKFPRFERRIV